MSKVTIIGAGLIGSSWAVVFARAGLQVCVYDAREASFDFSRRYVRDELLAAGGAAREQELLEVAESIQHTTDLKVAVADAIYVQESVFERLGVKQEIFAALDRLVSDQVVLASSTSGIPSSSFTENLTHRGQCLIAHPVNPPHLISLVEVVPAPWTSESAVKRTMELRLQVGQSPIRVRKEIESFILNRLQGALLNEAWALYQEGYASVAEIDMAVRDGLSPRWSFMGPFQTIDMNAPGGIVDYAQRLAPLYFSIAQSRVPPVPWSDEAIQRAEAEINQIKKQQGDTDPLGWRNDRLRSFKAWRTEMS